MAGSSKKEVEERQRLHTLVQLQAQEVEALKAEIAILSRKGGLYLEFKNFRLFKFKFYLVLRSYSSSNSASSPQSSSNCLK